MTCCASEAFAESLSSASPFKDADAAVSLARHIWWTQVCILSVRQGLLVICQMSLGGNHQHERQVVTHAADVQLPVTAWLAALAAHPRIGDVDALRKKFDSFTEHSQQEQAAASHAPVNVLQVCRTVLCFMMARHSSTSIHLQCATLLQASEMRCSGLPCSAGAG